VYALSGELDYTLNKLETAMLDTAERQLRELAGQVSSRVSVDFAMQTGIPWECIVNRAAANRDDLIVMGTHGRSGLKHLFIGSVAERVVQHAPCSVLIVRTGPAAPQAAGG
jgi:universal stress protein A